MDNDDNATTKSKSWREDRPPEDPDKMKRWGYVSAQPSEYLIHYRKGKLRERTSGQGASCFKLPTDTVALVPTTIKEVFFQANQITRDNVDVRIKGMTVYHISDPLKIYRLINFSFRERAEEKLAKTLSDMCRSHAKWLVANMTVEEAIRKRKEEIGATLKQEVERVVSAEGSQGWGLTIDTIDINDIYIVSDAIFQSIQEDYKNRARLEAERSRIETERDLHQRAIDNEKTLSLQRIQAARETRIREIEKDKEAALLRIQADAETKGEEIRSQEHLKQLETERENRELSMASGLAIAALHHQRKEEAERIANETDKARLTAEKDRSLAELSRAVEELRFSLDALRVEWNNRLAREKVAAECEREDLKADQALRARQLEVQGESLQHEESARFRRAIRDIDNVISDDHLKELFVNQALPEIARAFASQFGRIHMTQIAGAEGPASPFAGLAGAFHNLLEVAKIHGIDLEGVLRRKPSEEDHP